MLARVLKNNTSYKFPKSNALGNAITQIAQQFLLSITVTLTLPQWNKMGTTDWITSIWHYATVLMEVKKGTLKTICILSLFFILINLEQLARWCQFVSPSNDELNKSRYYTALLCHTEQVKVLHFSKKMDRPATHCLYYGNFKIYNVIHEGIWPKY